LPSSIALTPWSLDDHDLLHALNSDPVQMAHVGGPETDVKIADRNAKYAKDPGQLRISVDGEAAGWVGFWEREWKGERVYEFGWSVLRAFQGRGVATRATLLALDVARETDGAGGPVSVHAFPNTGNAPSNAVCRRAGFTLLGEVSFEYPPGNFETVNDWRLDL
jgi:RimJ/RimL family protein N-acetyltransferase